MTVDPATATFARTVLSIAADVEAAERAIKDAILAAARAGDCARVIDIVTRWQNMPAAEVLNGPGNGQGLAPSEPTGLASCGASEVLTGRGK